MGLTVHANFKSNLSGIRAIRQVMKQMRNICLDLPFKEVSDIVELTKNDFVEIDNNKDHALRHLLLSGCAHIEYDRQRTGNSISYRDAQVYANHYIGFTIWPGEGSESMDIYLATYPKTVDIKFEAFPWNNRRLKTNLKGWSGHSFCKTQYASDPECGGIVNFIRCHITLITALEKMKELEGIEIEIDDEGKYGPSRYSDDYKEAYAAGKEPTYVWHPGKYSPAELIKEIGEWNEMIAGFGGALKDAVGNQVKVDSPIFGYENFEHLEFKGQEAASNFVKVLKTMMDYKGSA